MPITVNEGRALYELDTITSNEGGTLYSLDTVHSNENGVLNEIFSNSVIKELSWYVYDTSQETTITDYDGNGLYIKFIGDERNGVVIRECRTQLFTVGSSGVRIGAWMCGIYDVTTSIHGNVYFEIIKVEDDGSEITVSNWADGILVDDIPSNAKYNYGSAYTINLSKGKYYLKVYGDYCTSAWVRVAFGAVATGTQLSLNFDNGTSVSSGNSSSAVFSVTTPTAVDFYFRASAAANSVSTPSGTSHYGGGTGLCELTLFSEEDKVTCRASSTGAMVNDSVLCGILLLPNVNYSISLSTTLQPGGGTAEAQLYRATEQILT